MRYCALGNHYEEIHNFTKFRKSNDGYGKFCLYCLKRLYPQYKRWTLGREQQAEIDQEELVAAMSHRTGLRRNENDYELPLLKDTHGIWDDCQSVYI